MENNTLDYGYWSKLLNKAFDDVTSLKKAEADYRAEQSKKESKAAEKKADATKVENAFKEMNAARKVFKQDLATLKSNYAEDLKALKTRYEKDCDKVTNTLAEKEKAYSDALDAFTKKYPEGYHITFKDGDVETTISSSIGTKRVSADSVFDLLDFLFF